MTPTIWLITVESNKKLRLYGRGFYDTGDGVPVKHALHIAPLGEKDAIFAEIHSINGAITGTDIDITPIGSTIEGYECWIIDVLLGTTNHVGIVVPAVNVLGEGLPRAET